MEIVNEIKSKDDADRQKFVSRSLAEVQRAKLEKLMKNPVNHLETLGSNAITFVYFRRNLL